MLAVVVLLFGISVGAKAPANSGEVKTEVKPEVLSTKDLTVIQEVNFKEASPEELGIKAPILMYHYIQVNPNPQGDPSRDKLLVTPTNFEAQLQYLKENGWTTISLDELVEGLKNPGKLPEKPIILTFDDGYLDFYTTAAPLLAKYNMKGAVYVLSQGSKRGPGFYMTDEQIKELSTSPLITIASHTQTHTYLKGRSEPTQRREIIESKKELEALIGKPVEHFAYPYGAFDETSLRLVKEAGYKSATSTIISTKNNLSNLHTLRRVRMGNLSISWFTAQLAK